MSTINKVVLLGNVGNVEVKDFEFGKKLVQLSLATQDGYKKADGTWVNKTEWHRCIFAIPTLAEKAATIQQGDKIYVEGSINTNSWTTKDGEKKEIKEISCTMFKTFSKAANRTESTTATTTATEAKSLQKIAEDSDDLPF
jgi:single stranded DNA-binding protein